jgi:hypothetical protein
MSEAISDFAKRVSTASWLTSLPSSRQLSDFPIHIATSGQANYDRLSLDPKYRHFVRIPGRIVCCLDYFRIPVDRIAATRILHAYYLFIGIVDNAIDSGETNIAALVFDQLETPANQSNLSDVGLVTEYLKSHLTQDLRPTVLDKLRTLNEKVIEERSANSIDSYIQKRKDVGYLTAELSYILIRPLLDRDHHRLRVFMARVGEVGCLVDSVIDLGADRKRGLLSFRPNIRCRVKLLFSALLNGLAVAFKHPRLAGLFLQAIADNVGDRVRMNSRIQSVRKRKSEGVLAD